MTYPAHKSRNVLDSMICQLALGQFEKFWVLNFGIAAKAHFKKSAILVWRIHRIEWLE